MSSADFIVLQTMTTNVSTYAGASNSGTGEGPVLTAQFNSPTGIARDSSGNLYIADTYNKRIRKITPAGIVSTVTTFSNPSSVPIGLAVDNAGNIYVADNNLNLVFKVTAAGATTVLAGAGPTGYSDGTGAAAHFNHPFDVAVDAGGNVYVADAGNNRIRKITPLGAVTTFAGSDTASQADGMGSSSLFNAPHGITIDGAGNLYVAEIAKIRKITAAGVVTTIAGHDVAGFADGLVSSAQFNFPKGITVDGAGNIFVTDRTRIRKISAGLVNTVAGNGTFGFADGSGLNASFSEASGVVIDNAGNLFVADNGNNRIRKVTF
jgi:sugar lactone lactonase YvrE